MKTKKITMGKLIVVCQSCGKEHEVDENLAGSLLTCSNCNSLIQVSFTGIKAGIAIGGFILEKRIGVGAMGEVWLANQKTMERKVALKFLARQFNRDPQFVERFLKEVKLSAKMDHPNMVTAFDAGCVNQIYYLATSFVDGFTLQEKLDEVKGAFFDERDAINIMLDISSALCYAWNEYQIIHRDLKPANIMVDKKGVGKLLDLGISKSIKENADFTKTGTIMGTPYYMSPEQGLGEKNLDFHTDIYSLGATLYHLVTGEIPFDASSTVGIISKHITEPFPPPQKKNSQVSDDCSVLLETMMAKDPTERQDSWEAVIKDMELVLAGKFASSKKEDSDSGDSLVMRVGTIVTDPEEDKKITWKTTEKK